MAIIPKNRQFVVKASIIVYKDGEEHKRLTVDNPVFYSSRKQTVVTIQTIPATKGHLYTISGRHPISLADQLRILKAIVSYANLDPNRSEKYKNALERFGLTNIGDLVATYQTGEQVLNLKIEVKTTSEDKPSNTRSKSKLHLTTFRFRVMDKHPDFDDAKPLTDWIELDCIGNSETDDEPIGIPDEETGRDYFDELKDAVSNRTRQANIAIALSNLHRIMNEIKLSPSGPVIRDVMELRDCFTRLLNSIGSKAAIEIAVVGIKDELSADENMVRVVVMVLNAHLEAMVSKSTIDKIDIDTLDKILSSINIKKLSQKLENKSLAE